MRAIGPLLFAGCALLACGAACDFGPPGPSDGGGDAGADTGGDAAADASTDGGAGDASLDGGGGDGGTEDGAVPDAAAPAGVRVREASGAVELVASADGRFVAARDSVGPDGLGRLIVAATGASDGGSADGAAVATGVEARSFALSEDGAQVAYTRHATPGARGSVHLAGTADLAAPRKLGDGVYPRNLHFIGGGSHLIWLGDAQQQEGLVRGTLYWAPMDGAPAALAAATPWLFAASRDGRWIAFADGVDPFTGSGALRALDTAGPSPATPAAVAASATSIAVSPDGLRIAWTGAGSAGPEIFADALPPTGAPTALGAGELPVFSPDGQRLAFRRDGALMLWDAAAGPPRLAATGMAAAWPSFSPDGSRALFFRTWTASQSGALSGDLYAIDPLVESASAQLVASGASPRRVDSPDRQWSALFAKGALALVEWRAGGPYATSFGSAVQVGDAAFSPDSAHLAYVAAGGLRLRALADGAETPVAAGVISGRYAFAGADRIAAVQGAGASGAGDLVARPVGSAGEAGLVAEGAAEVRALGGRRIAYTVLGGPHAGLWVVDLE